MSIYEVSDHGSTNNCMKIAKITEFNRNASDAKKVLENCSRDVQNKNYQKSKIAINKDFFHESAPVCHDFGKFCIGFVSQ